jgi:hypothetical protein
MNFRVQFLDAFAMIIAEWPAYAVDAAGAVALVEGLAWPVDALRMQILDEDGRLVHWRARAEDG